jgi:hypothetical protein
VLGGEAAVAVERPVWWEIGRMKETRKKKTDVLTALTKI